jgi:NAD(P)-dependent dehydrogenase (short-subunit alcohol dehydrogenase family)
MKSFSSKVGAVSGAGSGIGRALALELAGRGCHLSLSDIAPQGLGATADACRQKGVRVTTHEVDVASREQVFAWAAATLRDHGSVNLLFNNAGVALAAMAESQRPDDMEWLMGINFWGVVHGTHAFLPHLKAGGDGHVVNLSSLFGLLGMPMQSAYNASKFAVRGYTEALRMELELEGAPVGATCVHPGGVATNIAFAARVDPGALAVAGRPEAEHRERSNRLLQTTRPEAAARQILAGVQRNARRVLVGPDAKVLDVLVRLLGAAYQPLVVRRVRQLLAAA